MKKEIISKVMKEMGTKGGKMNVAKHGKDRMKEIGRLGGLQKAANKIKPK